MVELRSEADGSVDPAALATVLDDSVAALMVTLPEHPGAVGASASRRSSRQVHDAGAYLYGDGANLNAIVGRIRFGDLGFDVVHLNLHKSFSLRTVAAGPVLGRSARSDELAPFLPAPVVGRDEVEPGNVGAEFASCGPEASIGRLQQFHGSIGVLLRAYAYIRRSAARGCGPSRRTPC